MGRARERVSHGFLGQGAHGCAFSPSLPCVNGKGYVSKAGTTVGKVFKLSNGDAEDELKIARKVKRLDPHHQFTVELLGRCQVDPLKIAEAPGGAQCTRKMGLPLGFPKRLVEQLVYKSAGDTDLQGLLAPGARPLSWAERSALLVAFPDVLRGVETLRAAGYAHLDLHPGNVMIDRSKSVWRMRIIDFGWLRPLRDTLKSWSELMLFSKSVGLKNHKIHTPFKDAGSIRLASLAVKRASQGSTTSPPMTSGSVNHGIDWLVKLGGRVLVSSGTLLGPLSAAFVEEAGWIDSMAAGSLLWHILAHPPRGSQRPPVKARPMVEALATLAALLTHPDPRRRITARQARMAW